MHIERSCANIVKIIYEKNKADVLLYREKLKTFFLRV